jgi:thiamine-monophosphate kinase
MLAAFWSHAVRLESLTYNGGMEAEFVRWLREHLPSHPALRLGLGDDAAVLGLAGRSEIVITTDLVSDGVDFQLQQINPRRAGRKALAVNLSDLAAMAARPLAAVVAIALPRAGANQRSPFDLAVALYEGMLPLAEEFGLAIAGGDTNTHDGPLVVSVTALGEITDRGPLTRRGGRVGDKLLVTGRLGGSIHGHHLDFTPRVREALALHERYQLDAGMDLSDGLALDLSRLAAESNCGAVIHVDRVPISDAAQKLVDPLRHALGDGEDFELLVAVPPAVADAILHNEPLDCRVTCVGELIAESGLWQQTAGGERKPLEPTGWQH